MFAAAGCSGWLDRLCGWRGGGAASDGGCESGYGCELCLFCDKRGFEKGIRGAVIPKGAFSYIQQHV